MCFPLLEIFICFPSLYLFSCRKIQSVFNAMSSFWKQISVFQYAISYPRNLDLFSNYDVISWNRETDDCKDKPFFLEIIICFPIFRVKAISWKGETDILWKQPRRLLLEGKAAESLPSK